MRFATSPALMRRFSTTFVSQLTRSVLSAQIWRSSDSSNGSVADVS